MSGRKSKLIRKVASYGKPFMQLKENYKKYRDTLIVGVRRVKDEEGKDKLDFKTVEYAKSPNTNLFLNGYNRLKQEYKSFDHKTRHEISEKYESILRVRALAK